MGTRAQAEVQLPKLDALGEDFEAFQARFASLFARSEPRRKAVEYIRALMGPVERRNGWQIAEAVGDARPDSMERLLYRADWDEEEARDRLLAFSVEQFGDPEGIGVLDETGFVKKGDASAGVARQYCSPLGKVDNCQVGVFLSYAAPRGHVLLDRRLYLPQSWCDDPERRERAHIPRDVTFKTKPELALEMLRHAWTQGVPMAWVTGDEVYGNDPALRAALEEAGRRYVLAVASTTRVWLTRPELKEPEAAVPARQGARPRLVPGPSVTVAEVVAKWPSEAWHRIAVHEGEKGPIEYDWACARVVESRDRLPASDVWLLVRRSLSNPSELAYYLSDADSSTPLETLARVASVRYTIEQCFEEAKDDVGLDQYEVRTYSSWHRYMTLSMMAHAWLASVRAKLVDSSSALSERINPPQHGDASTQQPIVAPPVAPPVAPLPVAPPPVAPPPVAPPVAPPPVQRPEGHSAPLEAHKKGAHQRTASTSAARSLVCLRGAPSDPPGAAPAASLGGVGLAVDPVAAEQEDRGPP